MHASVRKILTKIVLTVFGKIFPFYAHAIYHTDI
jgi:hypothetical protein